MTSALEMIVSDSRAQPTAAVGGERQARGGSSRSTPPSRVKALVNAVIQITGGVRAGAQGALQDSPRVVLHRPAVLGGAHA
jgi:hypothetical protein